MKKAITDNEYTAIYPESNRISRQKRNNAIPPRTASGNNHPRVIGDVRNAGEYSSKKYILQPSGTSRSLQNSVNFRKKTVIANQGCSVICLIVSRNQNEETSFDERRLPVIISALAWKSSSS